MKFIPTFTFGILFTTLCTLICCARLSMLLYNLNEGEAFAIAWVLAIPIALNLGDCEPPIINNVKQ